MNQAQQRQKGEDSAIAERDVNGNGGETHQQRDQAALQQAGAQGGADRIHGGAFSLERADAAVEVVEHGLGLVAVEGRKAKDERSPLVQHLSTGAGEIGRLLGRGGDQAKGSKLLADRVCGDGRAGLGLGAAATSAHHLNLGTAGEIEARFERRLNRRLQPAEHQSDNTQQTGKAGTDPGEPAMAVDAEARGGGGSNSHGRGWLRQRPMAARGQGGNREGDAGWGSSSTTSAGCGCR